MAKGSQDELVKAAREVVRLEAKLEALSVRYALKRAGLEQEINTARARVADLLGATPD